MQIPDICIWHGGCTDGFTAAWAVWKRFGDSIEYHAGKYGQNPPDVTGKRVLLVDFSYKSDVLSQMALTAASITILDHHKTAQADLLPLFADGTIDGVFDMGRSGAGIAWDYYHPNSKRPRLVRYVEDRDLWRWKLNYSREISGYIGSIAIGEFPAWSELAHRMEIQTEYSAMIKEGRAINRKLDLDVEKLAKKPRWVEIGGVLAPCVNANMTFASDLANRLARIPEAPFGATWYEDRDGNRVYSLRSIPEKMDVSDIALKYGGGGHRDASGFLLREGAVL